MFPAEDTPAISQSSLIFIIDFSDFMCFFCLDSFLGFYHSLPARYRHERAFGVLAVDQAGIELGVLHKKLRGFVTANQVEFPIVLDHSGIFKGMAEQGTSVILIDAESQNISRYIFPLSPEQQDEILSFLGRD